MKKTIGLAGFASAFLLVCVSVHAETIRGKVVDQSGKWLDKSAY